MKSNERASLQVLKITIVALLILFSCSIAVRAFYSDINSIKIILTNQYEMNVLTTKTTVKEILEENHIVVLPDETVFPSMDSQIGNGKDIKIIKTNSEENRTVELADSADIISLEQVLSNYGNIIEKIETIDEIIPYETITKNAASVSSKERTNQVLQQGKDGLKRVTYKVKYQNDIEIARKLIKEEIITKPVNKIVQITQVTSRTGTEETRKGSTSIAQAASNSYNLAKKVEGITPIVKTLNTSAYTASTCGKKPTNKGYGITASGKRATCWYTVAAGKGYPMGTIIYIPYFKNKPNGGWFVVQDRGGAITNNKLDVYMNTYNECMKFGRRNLECYIYLVK